MAYIGRDIEYGSLSKQSFVADSSTTSFSLNYDVASAMSLLVSVGGIVQEPDVGYTATGRTITFASAPISGDTVFIVFLGKELLVSSTTPQDAIDYQTMVGNGSNTLVLNHSVTNPQDLLVTYSGVNQKPGTDYTVSGTTLTFTTTPPTGMKVLVYFMALAGNTLWDGQVTNPKIVSMDASKLTGSMPSSVSEGSFAAQYQDLSTLALHWASVDNKVAMNLTDDFIDHFQDDSGWDAYNGVAFAAGEIADHSTTGHNITKYGNVATSTSIKKFGTSSIHCTGTQNTDAHLHVASSDDWNFGTNDFTIEFWGRFNSTAAIANIPVFTWRSPTSSTTSSQLWYLDHNVGLKLMIKNDSGGTIVADQNVGSTDTGNSGTDWTHFALVRNGNTWTHYRNGTSNWSTTNSDAHVNHDGGITLIGENTTSNSWAMNGYFDDIRISNNARYTANFSVPTAAFTNDSNTLFLMNGDDRAAVANTGSENVYRNSDEYVATGSSTALTDVLMDFEVDGTTNSSGWTASLAGSAAHSTADSKYGTGSLLTASSSNWLQLEPAAETVFNNNSYSGDFTIEFWHKKTSTGGFYPCMFLKGPNNANVFDIRLYTNSGGSIIYADAGFSGGSAHINGGSPGTTTNWQHYAVVRDGGSLRLYINGVELGNSACSGTLNNVYSSFYIGAGYVGTNVGVTHHGGYYDNFSISSSCRYPDGTSFTPAQATINYATTATATGSLLSTTSTADSTVSKASGVMLYKDGEGTNTIGTDLKAYFSADNGSNWTQAASYGSPTTFDGTTKVIPLGETTMLNTGTAVKLKAEWANQQASSGTEKIISPIGDATHSSNKVKIGNSSMYFDGTGDYISAANSSDWAFSGDFTAECWFYNTLSNSDDHLMGPANHSSGAGWGIYFNGTGVLKFNDYANSFVLNNGDANTGWSANKWHHVAVVRSGSTTKLYLDGIEKYSGSHSSALVNSGNFGIGSDNGTTASMHHNGYMDEVRLSDSARYTANFTPSTTAFTSDANTKLLIHSNESSESTTFTDSSSSTHTVTAFGDAKHMPPFKKFGISSLYCDGTGDLISVADSDDFVFTGDYTVEFWIYYVGTPANNTHICGQGGNLAGNYAFMFRCEPSGFFLASTSNGSTQRGITTTTNMSNAWHHVALVRSGTSQKVYINGTQEGSTLTHSDTIQNVAANWEFGGNSTVGSYLNAYFDEIRFSDTARYSANFTPSTTAFTSDANTKLLIHGDDTLGTIARTSSAGRWAGNGTSHATFSGSDFKATTGDKQSYTPEVINGDFQITGTWYGSAGVNSTGQSIANSIFLGVYATSETYTDSNDADNMTQIWSYDAPNNGNRGTASAFGYAQTNVGTFTPTNGDTFKMCRIGSTFYWYFADILRHTWTQTYSGPVKILMSWGGAGSVNSEILNFAWSGDLIPITDSSPIAGKIAQLHGWAVNY